MITVKVDGRWTQDLLGEFSASYDESLSEDRYLELSQRRIVFAMKRLYPEDRIRVEWYEGHVPHWYKGLCIEVDGTRDREDEDVVEQTLRGVFEDWDLWAVNKRHARLALKHGLSIEEAQLHWPLPREVNDFLKKKESEANSVGLQGIVWMLRQYSRQRVSGSLADAVTRSAPVLP